MQCAYHRATGDKILRAQHNGKDSKLLAAKKITYIEVNAPATNQIQNFF